MQGWCGASIGRVAAALVVAASLWIGTAPGAWATLISEDSSYGTGSLTLDTATNLQWLDLTQTQNLSFNDVSGQLGAGGQFAGFHFATEADVTTLFTDAGLPAAGITSSTASDLAAGTSLLSLLGQTESAGDDIGFFGFIAPVSDVADLGEMQIETPCQTGTGLTCVYDFPLGLQLNSASAADTPDPESGSFLVRDAPSPVPEPASASLLGAALAGLWIARHRHGKAA